MRPARLVACLVAALYLSGSPASAEIDQKKIAAAQKAAADFVKLAGNSAKTGKPPRESDPAVKALLRLAIGACKAEGKYVGICGQGPSDHPDFAQWLRDEGISSISLNPDSVVDTWQLLASSAK